MSITLQILNNTRKSHTLITNKHEDTIEIVVEGESMEDLEYFKNQLDYLLSEVKPNKITFHQPALIPKTSNLFKEMIAKYNYVFPIQYLEH